jgi:hypothetical protein
MVTQELQRGNLLKEILSESTAFTKWIDKEAEKIVVAQMRTLEKWMRLLPKAKSLEEVLR